MDTRSQMGRRREMTAPKGQATLTIGLGLAMLLGASTAMAAPRSKLSKDVAEAVQAGLGATSSSRPTARRWRRWRRAPAPP